MIVLSTAACTRASSLSTCEGLNACAIIVCRIGHSTEEGNSVGVVHRCSTASWCTTAVFVSSLPHITYTSVSLWSKPEGLIPKNTVQKLELNKPRTLCRQRVDCLGHGLGHPPRPPPILKEASDGKLVCITTCQHQSSPISRP